ncbi:MAG: helix-turn-helix transcriptional regulator [Anaerolineae bacterium]|nr:helix-turn-helix transcriptional regulator [Anaerolineae bacterium]MCX8067231.1 helix-turn-helix transcriptional regulator [Anaerolineae bacterium]MDW7992848.1 helix-turn-helix transcriptional regulator [Anaerolineae bacterium]
MDRREGHQRGCSRRTVRFLEPALLLLLHHGPAHGYTLLERLDSLGLGKFNPAVVYRTLREMEDRGWVVSAWDREQAQGPPRRVYRLTLLGDEVLRLWAQDLEETRRIVEEFLRAYYQHIEAHPMEMEA